MAQAAAAPAAPAAAAAPELPYPANDPVAVEHYTHYFQGESNDERAMSLDPLKVNDLSGPDRNGVAGLIYDGLFVRHYDEGLNGFDCAPLDAPHHVRTVTSPTTSHSIVVWRASGGGSSTSQQSASGRMIKFILTCSRPTLLLGCLTIRIRSPNVTDRRYQQLAYETALAHLYAILLRTNEPNLRAAVTVSAPKTLGQRWGDVDAEQQKKLLEDHPRFVANPPQA